jgi:hypothetical protein
MSRSSRFFSRRAKMPAAQLRDKRERRKKRSICDAYNFFAQSCKRERDFCLAFFYKPDHKRRTNAMHNKKINNSVINSKVHLLLALLIINKVPFFRNAYDLCKVFARRFDLIAFVDLMKELRNEEFIKEEIIAGLNHYRILPKGLEYLNAQKDWLRLELDERYPKEAEFIEAIWDRSDDTGIE